MLSTYRCRVETWGDGTMMESQCTLSDDRVQLDAVFLKVVIANRLISARIRVTLEARFETRQFIQTLSSTI
jgi:hypothetical protein